MPDHRHALSRADEGDTVRVVFDSVYSDAKKHITGEVVHKATGAFSRIEDSDGTEHTVFGAEAAGRDRGEVVKDGRRIGWYSHSIAPDGGALP